MAKTPVVPGESTADETQPPDPTSPPEGNEPPPPPPEMNLGDKIDQILAQNAEQQKIIAEQRAMIAELFKAQQKGTPAAPAPILPTYDEAMAESRKTGQGVLSRDGWVVWTPPPAPGAPQHR
jgi:hypothetical protein